MIRRVHSFAQGLVLMACAVLMPGASVAAELQPMPSADPVFSATLSDFDGKPVPLAELKGKLLVLNFWATWCGPCRTEIPHLIEAEEKYAPRGVVFMGAAVEDNADSVRDFGKAYGINYTVVMAGKDQGIALLRALGNKIAGLPFTIVLDRKGNIVAAKRGIMTPVLMQQILEPLL